jgi:hypothetical protein
VALPSAIAPADAAKSADGSKLQLLLTDGTMWECKPGQGAAWKQLKRQKAEASRLFVCQNQDESRRVEWDTVFDAKGEVLATLAPAPDFGQGCFSADGRWLAQFDLQRRCRVYSTKDWKGVWLAPGTSSTALSSDVESAIRPVWGPKDAWLAFTDGMDIHVIEAGTWRSLARLQSPLELPIQYLFCTPDGARIIAQRGGCSVEVWELPQLSREMKELGLDLAIPPPLPAPPISKGLEGPIREAELPFPTFGIRK